MSAHSRRSPLPVSDDYVHLTAIATEQRRELMAAKALDSDFDYAFTLQVQEAINASLALNDQPSTSSSSSAVAAVATPQSLPSDDKMPKIADLFADELRKLELELEDQSISEAEFRKLKDDLHRRIHDHQVALDISNMPDEEWQDWGDNFGRPFGEGSSVGANSDEIFRVYFKGLVEVAPPKGNPLGGIGVAICDSRDELLFELRKPLVGNGPSRQGAELRALIEAFNAALELQLKRLLFYCDYYPIFKFVTGRWCPKQKKVSALVRQVSHLQEKFTYCRPTLVARNDIKFAFKLAREAIVSQVSKVAESSSSRESYETCKICLEDTNIAQIFSVDDCQHRYCFSCMKQHVEVKLLHGLLPTCPHEDCETKLKIDSCRIFLTTRLIEIMSQRIKEASIPATEKIYCPYPRCSALMSKGEVLEYSRRSIVGAERSGVRLCLKCNDRFCINCKVPWHNTMSCVEYKRRNPYPQIEEAKLKSLAATNLWRQCLKCSHMIELAAGCYHMTCRCGNEFCYTCGAEWKDKKATCSCPLWDEDYIIQGEFYEEEVDDDDGYDDDGYYDSSEEDYL